MQKTYPDIKINLHSRQGVRGSRSLQALEAELHTGSLGRPSENQEEAGRKNFHLDSSGGDQTRTRRGRAAILYRNPL